MSWEDALPQGRSWEKDRNRMGFDETTYMRRDEQDPSSRWDLVTAPHENTSLDRLEMCLRDTTLWECYLKSISERPDLSVLNLAAVATKRHERGYDSCVDMRTREAWEIAGASLRRGVTLDDAITMSVPKVDENGVKTYSDVLYWPRSCVIGAPNVVAHAPSITYDISRPADIARLAGALEGVDVDNMPAISRWALYTHFGFPVADIPAPPQTEDLTAARRLLSNVIDAAKVAVELMEKTLDERQRMRMSHDMDTLERSQRETMRMQRMYQQHPVEHDGMLDPMSAAFTPPRAADRNREPINRTPAKPRPRPTKEKKEEEDTLTILDEQPKEVPPVLPLEEAVEQVRAKLFPHGKK